MIHEFGKSLIKGKEWEQHVFTFLNSVKDTVEVKDLSDVQQYQKMWVDWLRTYNKWWILEAVYFDIKTDYYVHKNGRIFIETGTVDKPWNLITTLAKYFFYLDPIKKLIYVLPVKLLRSYVSGRDLKLYCIKNKTFETYGVCVTIDDLIDTFNIKVRNAEICEGCVSV